MTQKPRDPTFADPSLQATGMATRRQVLGDAHVDRACAATTAFDADFQAFITRAAWGEVWSRPGLTRRERSLITLALLAAAGHDEEVAMHTRATANTGATPSDIKEALLHVALYAGVPAANRAFKIVKQTLAEQSSQGHAQHTQQDSQQDSQQDPQQDTQSHD